MDSFMPLQSVLGGLFIGSACGAYMLFAGRIAGNSGALKSITIGPLEETKAAFVVGLAVAGASFGVLLPTAFEAPVLSSLTAIVGGLAVGIGTHLGNGCTSGHGLCGLSRLSIRSLVAVPIFMVAAIATATAASGSFTIGDMISITETPQAVVTLSRDVAISLAAALVPVVILSTKSRARDAYIGLWSGTCFGAGLTIGGMVRPSVVIRALSPGQFDPTLWVLFVTALITTFTLYRVAAASGIKEATAVTGGPGPDAKLAIGACLFGVGWGLTGLCPGPHLVGLSAAALAGGPGIGLGSLTMAAVIGGQFLAPTFAPLFDKKNPPELSSLGDVLIAIEEGALIVDVRAADASEADKSGAFEVITGSLSQPWDRAKRAMSTDLLPSNKSDPIILHCGTGARAQHAKTFLASQDYSRVLNAGGPNANNANNAKARLHLPRISLLAQSPSHLPRISLASPSHLPRTSLAPPSHPPADAISLASPSRPPRISSHRPLI